MKTSQLVAVCGSLAVAVAVFATGKPECLWGLIAVLAATVVLD